MKDSEFIRPDNLHLFCNSNGHLLTKTPVGIVIEFPGMGGGSCLGGLMEFGPYETDYARELAENGILLLYTFPGPWSWMNKGAVRICDAILDAAILKYGMAEDCPIVSSGGSMGGHGAMLFCIESRRKMRACVAACPNFDAWGELWKRDHRPRAVLSAIAAYDMPLDEAVKSISVTEQMDRLPRIPYFIVGDDLDECFDIADTDAFIEKLRAKGFDVDYRRLKDCRHGWWTPESRRASIDFAIKYAKG